MIEIKVNGLKKYRNYWHRPKDGIGAGEMYRAAELLYQLIASTLDIPSANAIMGAVKDEYARTHQKTER